LPTNCSVQRSTGLSNSTNLSFADGGAYPGSISNKLATVTEGASVRTFTHDAAGNVTDDDMACQVAHGLDGEPVPTSPGQVRTASMRDRPRADFARPTNVIAGPTWHA
jgi:hypothetical protein